MVNSLYILTINETFYLPNELIRSTENFAAVFSNEWYHESLDKLTPADVYYGRAAEVKTGRERIRRET